VFLGSILLVGDNKGQNGAGRSASVPIAQWWYDTVEALVGKTGKLYQAKQLAEGIGVDPDRISKIRKRVDAPMDIVEAISDFLKIPRPFVTFPDRDLAHEYSLKVAKTAKEIALKKVRQEVAELEAGVTAPEYTASRRRTHKLQTSEHADRPRRNRGGGRRRKRVG
jgi:hypothetical protein